MIYLNSNPELKNVYSKIIKTTGERVEWNGVFIIRNNTIILPGGLRSMFLNLDSRTVRSNIEEMQISSPNAFEIGDNKILINTINMLLYAFGKWGSVKGLKVEHDYKKLSALFKNILDEIHIEVYFSDNGLKFFKDGIQVTFEDVILREEEEIIKREEQADAEESLGLWHGVKWKVISKTFESEKTDKNILRSGRLGNNFYMTNYQCPDCKNHLHMVVYPEGKEYAIDTDEGKVYISRAYYCDECGRFYTPRPDMLLKEGQVYTLSFEDDRKAVRDYRALLGKRGERTSNCRFNMFEGDYCSGSKVSHSVRRNLREVCAHLEILSIGELEDILARMDEGFYRDFEVERFMAVIEQELFYRRKMNEKKYGEFGGDDDISGQEGVFGEPEKKKQPAKHSDEMIGDTEVNNFDSQNYYEGNLLTKDSNTEKTYHENEKEKKEKYEKTSGTRLKINENKTEENSDKATAGKKNADKENTDRDNVDKEIIEKGGKENKSQIGYNISNENKSKENENLQNKPNNKKENAIKNKKENSNNNDAGEKVIDDSNGKSNNKIHEKMSLVKRVEASERDRAFDLLALIQDIKSSGIEPELQQKWLGQLGALILKKGQEEIEYLMSHLPANMNRERYERTHDRLNQYRQIDGLEVERYQEILETKLDKAEQTQIKLMIRKIRSGDRGELKTAIEDIRNGGYQERNAQPFIEQLQMEIRELDDEALAEIVPDMNRIGFSDGVKAIDEIENSDLLPEIKEDAVRKIKKRLTKLKMDECEQLVHKLQKKMSGRIIDYSRIYFYDVYKMNSDQNTDRESSLVRIAVSNCASYLEEYEYPLMICDSSMFSNGKDGFVLTPDRIFYKGFLKSGSIEVKNIQGISVDEKGKELLVQHATYGSVKLPCVLGAAEKKSLSEILDDFIEYLKEKPESREVSYLEKEKHEKKCCYRCGHIYTVGNICPKCGNRNK